MESDNERFLLCAFCGRKMPWGVEGLMFGMPLHERLPKEEQGNFLEVVGYKSKKRFLIYAVPEAKRAEYNDCDIIGQCCSEQCRKAAQAILKEGFNLKSFPDAENS